MLKEKYGKEIDEILSRYPVKRSALIPLLYVAQRDQGYVSEAVMQEIAQILGLTPPQAYETVTFYTMFNLKPVGKFHIQVCRSLMCALVGSDTMIGWIKAKLGIAPGESTTDGLFTLSAVECLAACGTGPMMQINEDYYEHSGRWRLENDRSVTLCSVTVTGFCLPGLLKNGVGQATNAASTAGSPQSSEQKSYGELPREFETPTSQRVSQSP